MTMPKRKKIDRKEIDEAVLSERLGLREDWIDRWERDGERLQESSAPVQLPAFIRNASGEIEIAQAEAAIDRLVVAGCNRRVVYFCLEQLSPAAMEIRSGREWTAVPCKDGSDDSLHMREGKLKPSEDLKKLATKAKVVKKEIHLYQRELLLAAQTNVHPLPDGMTTRLELAEDAIALLESSLAWIAKLAEGYAAPYATTLLKSKGLIFLTAYVWMYAESGKLRGPQHNTGNDVEAANKPQVRAQREVHPHDNALASVVNCCTGKDGGWSPSELYAKLDTFRTDHPRLYALLYSKLKELHDFLSR